MRVSFEEAKVTHTSLIAGVWQPMVNKVEFIFGAQNLKKKIVKKIYQIVFWSLTVAKCQNLNTLFPDYITVLKSKPFDYADFMSESYKRK